MQPPLDVPEREMLALVLGANPYRRAGIRRTLEAAAIGILDDVADHSALLHLKGAHNADIVVLDGPLHAQAGAHALCSLTARPQMRLVAMLAASERSYLLALLRMNVRGLVDSDGRPEELVRAVHCVLDGGLYISPVFAEAVIDALLSPTPQQARAASEPREALTPRERDVVTCLAHGLPNADIAATLHISEKTVKFHVSNILSKYQFRSRAQLIVAMISTAPS